MMAALGGVNMIFGLGLLETGITFDYAKLLIDNEIARMIKETLAGIRITRETLALDIIREVGPGGEFISHEHTYQHFREELSQYKLFDKQTRSNWEAQGGKDLVEKAYEEAKKIVESHKPMALPSGAAAKIQDIVKEAEEHYGVIISKGGD
jgi:trimethylamine--corrinoid protein Co-methyltransferase